MAGMTRYFPDARDARPGTVASAQGVAGAVDAMQRTLRGKGVKTRAGGQVIIQGGGEGSSSRRGAAIMKIGKFASLNADGNTMEVYLYDKATDGWEAATTTVYKPFELQAQFYNGETLTYADGTTRDYDVTDLEIKYQRRASWTESGDDYSVVEEITPLYRVGEWLYIVYDQYGNKIDDNNNSKGWMVNGDVSP